MQSAGRYLNGKSCSVHRRIGTGSGRERFRIHIPPGFDARRVLRKNAYRRRLRRRKDCEKLCAHGEGSGRKHLSAGYTRHRSHQNERPASRAGARGHAGPRIRIAGGDRTESPRRENRGDGRDRAGTYHRRGDGHGGGMHGSRQNNQRDVRRRGIHSGSPRGSECQKDQEHDHKPA